MESKGVKLEFPSVLKGVVGIPDFPACGDRLSSSLLLRGGGEEVGSFPVDVGVGSISESEVRGLYGDVGVEIERVLGNDVGGEVDEKAELKLLRFFAGRLFRSMHGKIERRDFFQYLTQDLGLKRPEADAVWDRLEGGLGTARRYLDGYVAWAFSDFKVVIALMKVFGEIRGLTRQIVERDLKSRKSVLDSAVAELIVEVAREVENRLNGVGADVAHVQAWREWFSDYGRNFMAKNAKHN